MDLIFRRQLTHGVNDPNTVVYLAPSIRCILYVLVLGGARSPYLLDLMYVYVLTPCCVLKLYQYGFA